MEFPEDLTSKLICKDTNVCGNKSGYLAMFSNGSIEKANAHKIKFWNYENSHTPDGLERKKIRKILVAEFGKLQYSGLNYGTQASQRGDQCRYFIGVRNKKTGEMTVHGVQMVHCVPLFNTTTHEDDEDNYKDMSYIEKIDMLTSAFGSKRKRQAMESRLSYARRDNDDGSTVADSIDVSDLRRSKPSSIDSPGSMTAQVIPPRDSSTTLPHKVYDIKDIISQGEYLALEPLAKALLEATTDEIKQWKADSTYGQLVILNLESARSSIDLNKAKILVYYNFLIQVSRLLANAVRRKDPLPNVPEPFKRKLLENFTLSSTNQHGNFVRSMPSTLKDKAIIHSMILALFIENFRVELPILQNDFRKGQVTLVKMANALGCHIITQKKNGVSIKIAELKIPLFVPSEKNFRKK